jgi:glycosyltransferase involved in cell wall biosynthesis
MHNEHPYRVRIEPVPACSARPVFSVMIPTYNSAGYLRETLASVLRQDPGPEIMQIEVVDNCSDRDDPSAIVDELGRGRVGFFRQSRNLGHFENFRTCLERSRGHLIHLLFSDDCVREGFYAKLGKALYEHPDIGAAFCRMIFMDGNGHWQHLSPLEQCESGVLDRWLEKSVVRQRLQYVSMIVRRDVYEHLGGFDRRLYHLEDWEMVVRIAAHYPIWYEVEPLALHRFYPESYSWNRNRTGETIQGLRKVVEVVGTYLTDHLSEPTAHRLLHLARETCAHDALYIARRMIEAGEMGSAMTMVREALKCSRSHRVLRPVAELFVWLGERRVQELLARYRPGREGQWDAR